MRERGLTSLWFVSNRYYLHFRLEMQLLVNIRSKYWEYWMLGLPTQSPFSFFLVGTGWSFYEPFQEARERGLTSFDWKGEGSLTGTSGPRQKGDQAFEMEHSPLSTKLNVEYKTWHWEQNVQGVSKKRLFYDSCFTGGSGLLQRAGYQSKTLSIIFFWLIGLLLTQLPILTPF